MISSLQVRMISNLLQNPVIPFPGAQTSRRAPANVPPNPVADPEERIFSPWTGEAAPRSVEDMYGPRPATEKAKEFGSP